MNREREMCALLGNQTVVDILRVIVRKDAVTASEVARSLQIHVATAVKYLSALYDLNVLDREIRKTGRRPAYAYHLESDIIRIEFRFSDAGVESGWASLYSLFETVKQLYGSKLPEETPLLECLESGRERGLLRFEEDGFGDDELERAESYLVDFARRNFGTRTAELIVRKVRKNHTKREKGERYES